jgi:hypothetical protein
MNEPRIFLGSSAVSRDREGDLTVNGPGVAGGRHPVGSLLERREGASERAELIAARLREWKSAANAP